MSRVRAACPSNKYREAMRLRHGPAEPEYRTTPAPSRASADLSFADMVTGFVDDPEFRAMVEDESRIAMFAGRSGRRPLPARRDQ